MIDKTISHYNIIEKIGQGGMGEVYLARDINLQRKVAIKFLSQFLTIEKKIVERFELEARIAAQLNHPNIVTIYEIDRENDQLFIVMEFVQGGTLGDQLKDPGLSINEVINYSKQIAAGLQNAHVNGIIHRDIKPTNVLLAPDGLAKIVDFGLAKLAGTQRLTKTGQVVGTVVYMSPEQARGGDVDYRTDIWSLGVILYEMICSRLPFGGDYDQAVIYSILNENPPAATSIRPELPQEINGIIEKCLNKNINQRYTKHEDLIQDLEKLNILINETDHRRLRVSTARHPSIAVLPFTDMSPHKDQDYFCDGISEELINGLTQIKNLHVAARTSSFCFRGRETNIREIGQQLKVDTILEGSVRKAGAKLRITAQLVNAEDGFHIWSERYDRNMEDIFVVQDEITSEVISKLKVKLLGDDEPVAERRTTDLEAYEWYLKGHYAWHKFTVEHIHDAVACYEKAIELDPKFALAYAALAEVHIFQSTAFGLKPSQEGMPLARKLAEKALKLDPFLPEAYMALGMIATWYDWDSQKAKYYFKKSIELNPSSAGSYLWLEFPYSLLDQNFAEAHRVLRRSLELDPLNLLVRIRMGYVYYYQREFDKAIAEFQKTLDVEPNFAMGYHSLIDAYGQKKQYDKAFKVGEKTLKFSGRISTHIAVLGYYYGRAGKIEQCEKFLDELYDQAKQNFVSPVWFGVIYMGMNEFDAAFEKFEKAFEQRDGNLLYCVAPPFDVIRGDPRFIRLRKNMGLHA